MLLRIALLSFLPAFFCAPTQNETEVDENYGKTWMYFPDGNLVYQKVNLSDHPVRGRSSEKSDDADEDKVVFKLYTRKNKEHYSELVLPDDDAKAVDPGSRPFGDEHFDPSLDVKLVTHGWLSSGSSDSCVLIKDAYLDSRDCNVIVVDWQPLAANYFYLVAAFNTRIAGKKAGRLMNYLIDGHGMPPERFHMIGHSLGAHVTGYAGNMTRGRIARLTGLDPAKPGFETLNVVEDRLDRSDGRFVDVIHTCAGVLGYADPLGTVDFYPNGGTQQPGCGDTMHMCSGCSHGRCYQYFAESILNSGAFPAKSCASERNMSQETCTGDYGDVHMGDPVPLDVEGIFYLETNDEEPYGQGPGVEDKESIDE